VIQIKIRDSNKSIKNSKGSLISMSTKALDRLGLIDENELLEKKMVYKIIETFKKEGIIADVKIIH
jgi:hypothetical protein